MIRNYFKIIPVFLFLAAHFTDSPAEEIKTRDLSFGAGWARLGLRDLGISPLYYSGNQAFFSTGYRHQTNKVINHLEINFYSGHALPAINPGLTDARLKTIRSGMNYSHLRYIPGPVDGKIKWLLGGTLDLQYGNYKHNRYANSAINNYFFSTININSTITRPFIKNDRQWLLEFTIHMPVMASVIRHDYSYINPAGFLNHSYSNLQSTFKSIEFSSLKRFFGLNSELSAECRLRNNNALRISYRWEYLGHDNPNRLKSAVHGLKLQTIFNF